MNNLKKMKSELTRNNFGTTHSLDDIDQDHLVDKIVDSLGNADKPIQQRMVENLSKADPEFGRRVAEGLKLN